MFHKAAAATSSSLGSMLMFYCTTADAPPRHYVVFVLVAFRLLRPGREVILQHRISPCDAAKLFCADVRPVMLLVVFVSSCITAVHLLCHCVCAIVCGVAGLCQRGCSHGVASPQKGTLKSFSTVSGNQTSSYTCVGAGLARVAWRLLAWGCDGRCDCVRHCWS